MNAAKNIKSKLTIKQLKKIAELFAADCTATEIAKELSISRITINKYIANYRQILLQYALAQNWILLNPNNCTEYIIAQLEEELINISFIYEENLQSQNQKIYNVKQKQFYDNSLKNKKSEADGYYSFMTSKLKKLRGIDCNSVPLLVAECVCKYNITAHTKYKIMEIVLNNLHLIK